MIGHGPSHAEYQNKHQYLPTLVMSDDEPLEDILYYNISSQEWECMIITSPDDRIQYFTESERSFFKGKKRTTVISKVDRGQFATASDPKIILARRVIARLEFRPSPKKDTIVYGFAEDDLDNFFPKLKWPEG